MKLVSIGVLALFFVSACVSVGPRDVRIEPSQTLDVVPAATIVLNIAGGEVSIEASEDDQLHASLTFYCDSAVGKCADKAANVKFVYAVKNDVSTISIDPDSLFAMNSADLVYRFQIPDGERLTVDMDAGDLEISQLSRCVDAVVGAGNVEITASEKFVRSVYLNATIGDVSLSHSGDRVDVQRSMLVGAETTWKNDEGECRLIATVAAGNIEVHLAD
ncbi:MAG: hypothetical protein ACI9GW_001101 [Halieaceae bacterium]